MSAIGFMPRRKVKLFVSCHADYRREDFRFARTQSSAMRNMQWEHRSKPLQSWDRLFYTGLALAALAAALPVLF